MNAKLLFVATVALSIASSYALADDTQAPLTRAQVVGDLQQAAAHGTLRKTDYDDALTPATTGQGSSRDTVLAELAAARSAPKPLGPLVSRTYNQNVSELLRPSTVSRAQVKIDVREAMAAGTLQRTDYDADPQLVARRAIAHDAGLALFARLRGGRQAEVLAQANVKH